MYLSARYFQFRKKQKMPKMLKVQFQNIAISMRVNFFDGPLK